ncbi:hypothetical protein COEREDRAFT_36514 [Coemansia reversa NRRL 1564]|uniref:Mitochondrial cytochrome c oxidase assembly factor n=1 Tax=Coemansia reversa (strain ATCC 12441 / NRRL 1564) TaxID=763665 RepID=A0A2G5BKU8_COERN|nr:hypothetical protein COEREDRAFT_36514 [Coemansia reversa NRRL 1564]|eukprot:PIA19628.1 hypothetical protein COEREDRAFT_36514 [Coemansia reversa NRRL 1564]
MGGPGLEVAKFTFYMFMPIGFMVYFGGPGFYERYVADETFTFNPPPKRIVPSDTSEINQALQKFRQERAQRKLLRQQDLDEPGNIVDNPNSYRKA